MPGPHVDLLAPSDPSWCRHTIARRAATPHPGPPLDDLSRSRRREDRGLLRGSPETEEAQVDDTQAILATAQDYWHGWFDGDAERMARALHPALAKTGIGTDASGAQVVDMMTAQDLVGWTRDGEGVAEKTADVAFEVTVGDVYRQIATVTVHSGIYREYLHLVRTPDGWKILNALYTRVSESRPD
jgi:hypothetical protein